MSPGAFALLPSRVKDRLIVLLRFEVASDERAQVSTEMMR